MRTSILPGNRDIRRGEPGTVQAAKVEDLLILGVNRMSVGIQSFHDDELKTLGRIHTADEAIGAVQLLKNVGLRNFSVDLMYGIPGQSIETWEETLSKAIWLSPPHISAYELTPEEGTPLSLLIKDNAIEMPSEGLVLDMYDHVIDFLQGRGFEHYEISNFALPGFRCLHNLNYWDRGEYIGAGAGAHSFIEGVR
jgi:oxygen-independent coproporphyrinogen-3 oxidase